MCLIDKEKEKIIVFLILLVFLLLFFLRLDFVLFYLFFEISIIPTFILIIY